MVVGFPFSIVVVVFGVLRTILGSSRPDGLVPSSYGLGRQFISFAGASLSFSVYLVSILFVLFYSYASLPVYVHTVLYLILRPSPL